MEQTINKSTSAFLELLNYHVEEWIHCASSIKNAVRSEIEALYGADFANGVHMTIGWDVEHISKEGQSLRIVFPQAKPLSHDNLDQMFSNLGINKWYISGTEAGGLEILAYIQENVPDTDIIEDISESEVEADSHEEMADIDDGIVTDEINPDSDDEKKKSAASGGECVSVGSDDEIVRLYQGGLSIEKIARKISRSSSYVKLRLKRSGVKAPKKEMHTNRVSRIIEKYKSGIGLKKLAKEYSIGTERLRKLLVEYDVPIRQTPKWDNTEERYRKIVEMYKSGRSNREIMAEFGFKSDSAIYNALQHFNVSPNKK